MTKIQQLKIYVDLDGVLADFEGALQDRFGMTFSTAPSRGKLWGKIMYYNDNVEDWFYSLPLMSDAMELWAFVTTNFEHVEILSACGYSPKDAAGQKKAWVGAKLGYDVVSNIVVSSSEKAEFAAPDTLLIDDREKSTLPFADAGGQVILHTSAASTIAQLKELMKDLE